MHNEYVEMLFRLVAALAAGGIIGLGRSYRGAPPASAPTRWCAWPRAC